MADCRLAKGEKIVADCSKTEVFLAEANRMSMSCEGNFDFTCSCCPVAVFCNISTYETRDGRERIIREVQKWSDSHPAPKPKTYADVFFEKFPNAMTRPATCIPRACRGNIFGAHSVEPNKCGKDGFSCFDCWNEPYSGYEE